MHPLRVHCFLFCVALSLLCFGKPPLSSSKWLMASSCLGFAPYLLFWLCPPPPSSLPLHLCDRPTQQNLPGCPVFAFQMLVTLWYSIFTPLHGKAKDWAQQSLCEALPHPLQPQILIPDSTCQWTSHYHTIFTIIWIHIYSTYHSVLKLFTSLIFVTKQWVPSGYFSWLTYAQLDTSMSVSIYVLQVA